MFMFLRYADHKIGSLDFPAVLKLKPYLIEALSGETRVEQKGLALGIWGICIGHSMGVMRSV